MITLHNTLPHTTNKPNKNKIKRMKKLLSLTALTVAFFAIANPASAGTEVFIDYDKLSEWSVDSISILNEAGCIAGYPDGEFKPQEYATREEVAVALQRCLESLAVYLKTIDEKQNADILALQDKVVSLQNQLNETNRDILPLKYDYEKSRDHYVTLGAGFNTEDMDSAVVALEAKLELIEFGIASLSIRPGINTQYELYGALTGDFDINDKLEVYVGAGGAIRVTDNQAGALTQGKEDGEAVAYAQGGVALDLSNKTVMTLDAKVPISDVNDRGVVVTASIGLKF